MIYLLDDDEHSFPNPRLADEESGVLALGGDLHPKRLQLAYSLGIFPWYDEGRSPILWHSSAPRMVLFPDQLIVNRSLRRQMNRQRYEIRYDTAFGEVLERCAAATRPNQEGTWLNPNLRSSLERLHGLGVAHCVEAWEEGTLVGGLYGLTFGGVFFGESMFAERPDASKVAFVTLVQFLERAGYRLIDCQSHTDHLERFGAVEISRALFCDLLNDALKSRPTQEWPM